MLDAKQRVINASRELAMAVVGGRFNGSVRAALTSNVFEGATRYYVDQAKKNILADPATVRACETAERERTATIESDEEDERWQILVAARCAPDDERTEEALFELAEAELLPLADNGSAHAVLSATEMDEWREQLTEVVRQTPSRGLGGPSSSRGSHILRGLRSRSSGRLSQDCGRCRRTQEPPVCHGRRTCLRQ